jgi:hypothetical protein
VALTPKVTHRVPTNKLMNTPQNTDWDTVESTDLFCIVQWGEVKHKGTQADCERISKRWTEQHGNVELEVIPLQNP